MRSMRLLDAQAYRLSYWRVAVDEINYRRFFDVNDLAALRMNERGVFDSTHELIFELIDAGQHRRPAHRSFRRPVRSRAVFRVAAASASATRPRRAQPLYVVTEKILAAHERLPETWRVHGTTGYDFAALATSWLVYGESEERA